MAIKFHEVQIGEVNVKLRLTKAALARVESKVQANDYAQMAEAGALQAIKGFTPKTFIEIFSNACTGSVRYQRAILDEALNWKDSGNFVKTADDLFDLLDEHDMGDTESVATILLHVAGKSGVISKTQYDGMKEAIESADPTLVEKEAE